MYPIARSLDCRSQSYEERKKLYAEASAAFQKALSIDGSDGRGFMGAAKLLEKEGRFDEARSMFEVRPGIGNAELSPLAHRGLGALRPACPPETTAPSLPTCYHTRCASASLRTHSHASAC